MDGIRDAAKPGSNEPAGVRGRTQQTRSAGNRPAGTFETAGIIKDIWLIQRTLCHAAESDTPFETASTFTQPPMWHVRSGGGLSASSIGTQLIMPSTPRKWTSVAAGDRSVFERRNPTSGKLGTYEFLGLWTSLVTIEVNDLCNCLGQ